MSSGQLIAILTLAAPVALLVLWPLLRSRGAERAPAAAAGADRRLELGEERATVYRALRELDFDHQAGHLADDDYQALRATYEARAAEALRALDALGASPESARRGASERAPAAPPWTRSPATLAVGGVLLLVFGVVVGVSMGRYTESVPAAPMGAPAVPAMPPPVARLGEPAPGAASPGGGAASGRPIPPEMLQGMLQAARQSLMAGRYAEAIAAYQAVLKREPQNVDALTHLGFIVALGGHADAALETIDKALAIDPDYALARYYRGQVLYEARGDTAGAIKEWERFLTLVPSGPEHNQVQALINDARVRPAPAAAPTPPSR
ncbi:MAG TPA: tetratricopeptide repeat protein [Verrucomicrobiae bacterium]|nr:tetratricopeptide repeat protein [Verrucomicrobiae bacterium]